MAGIDDKLVDDIRDQRNTKIINRLVGDYGAPIAALLVQASGTMPKFIDDYWQRTLEADQANPQAHAERVAKEKVALEKIIPVIGDAASIEIIRNEGFDYLVDKAVAAASAREQKKGVTTPPL